MGGERFDVATKANDLATALYAGRLARGLTVDALAARSGVSRDVIVAVERERLAVQPQTFARLWRVLSTGDRP